MSSHFSKILVVSTDSSERVDQMAREELDAWVGNVFGDEQVMKKEFIDPDGVLWSVTLDGDGPFFTYHSANGECVFDQPVVHDLEDDDGPIVIVFRSAEQSLVTQSDAITRRFIPLTIKNGDKVRYISLTLVD